MNIRNSRHSEICIVVNDKSQGSIAKSLSYDGLLHYKFIIPFADDFFKNWLTFREVTGKMVDCVIRQIRLTFLSLTMQNSLEK